jgi:hypothetical protein
MQVVEDGYEFFAKRQLVTVFSAPNYCGEFDNAGAMMSVDEELMCSFQVGNHAAHSSPPPRLHPAAKPPSTAASLRDGYPCAHAHAWCVRTCVGASQPA